MACHVYFLTPFVIPKHKRIAVTEEGGTQTQGFCVKRAVCLFQELLDHSTCDSHKIPDLQKARRDILQMMQKATEGPEEPR